MVDGFFGFQPYYDMLLEEFSKSERHLKIVEIGVFHGKSLQYMNEKLKELKIPYTLYGVDAWGLPESNGECNCGHETMQGVQDIFRDESNVNLIQSLSWEAAKFFEDESLDAVFIDADHLEPAVTKDIEAWLPKVRPGGFIGGDDWKEDNGVRAAVDKAFDHVELMGRTEEVGLHFVWYLKK